MLMSFFGDVDLDLDFAVGVYGFAPVVVAVDKSIARYVKN